MKKVCRSFVLLLICLLAVGCDRALNDLPKEERQLITTRIYNKDYDTVFMAVMNAFQNKDYPILNTDKNAGLIVGDYKAVWGGSTLMKWTAIAKKMDDSTTKIELKPTIHTVTAGGVTIEKLTVKSKKLFDKCFNEIESELL